MGKEDRVSGARVLSLAAINAPRFSLYYPSIFHAMSALSAPAGHLPLEGKAPIREYPLLKRRRTTIVIPSAPRIVILSGEKRPL